MSKPNNIQPAKQESPDWKQELYDWIETLTSVLVFVILLFTFFFMVIGVSGNSMYPTLHDQDLMLVQRIGYTPKQNQVVILRKDSFSDQAIVKRVIAVGGQEVEIDYENNLVYVDGVALEEDYLNFENAGPGDLTSYFGDDYMVERSGMTYESFTVPEGSLFVMGDNRNGSTDSRYPELGFVDERYVIGRALGVFYPFDHATLLS